MFHNSRLGSDEGRFRYRVHRNEERRESTYFITYSKITPYTQLFKSLKIYTDGSVLENEQSGAEFVIPEFKTKTNKKLKKSFYFGKGGYIFTAELLELLMAS